MARELAGRCLVVVRYYSLPYGMTDKPTWDRDVARVADYGISLVTANGRDGHLGRVQELRVRAAPFPQSVPDPAHPGRVLLRRRGAAAGRSPRAGHHRGQSAGLT
jgi:hypothetical protein